MVVVSLMQQYMEDVTVSKLLLKKQLLRMSSAVESSDFVHENEDISSMLHAKLSFDDDILIDVVELCGEYAALQKKISNELARGYFLMAKARKNIGRLNCDNLRDDFDADYRVDCDTTGEFTAWITKPKSDPILLLSALPPPDLRHSQKCFQESLVTVIQLVSKINSIKMKMAKPINDSGPITEKSEEDKTS